MKTCSYCGRQNPEEAQSCSGCGTNLPEQKTERLDGAGKNAPLAPPVSTSAAPLPALAELDMSFEVVEGFSRPNWKSIRNFIQQRFSSEQKGVAWSGAAELWLAQLARDLGGDAHVYTAENFLCLSDLAPETARSVVSYAESVREIIRGVLGQAAWSGYSGKHVLLVFSDQEDYFAYISYFYGEGAHAMSSGIFIRTGYAHIALPYSAAWTTEHVLPHEMTHNLLCHLPIPLWLNEGLAVTIENRVSRHGLRLDAELVDRHRSFWAEENIQEFWSGASFHVPGDSIELSYSLAEIFVNLLSEKGSGFMSFIANANWRDGGQDAALNTLNLDLGELAAGFLGSGAWRPQRKAIAERAKAKSRFLRALDLNLSARTPIVVEWKVLSATVCAAISGLRRTV